MERAIASLQGLGHKRATLEAVTEERDAIISYFQACRSISGSVYQYVIVGRLIEDKTEQDAVQLTARIFTYLDEVELRVLREFSDDIFIGWGSFIDKYNSRSYTGYGSVGLRTKAMPNYLFKPGERDDFSSSSSS